MPSMKFLTLVVCLAGSIVGESLHGTITDPSGAVVPGALVQLRGFGGEKRQTTGDNGHYSFTALTAGKYQVRVIAKGFTISERRDFEISGDAVLDVRLKIETASQVVNVEEEANRVNTDPASNGGALVLGQKELAALSDDPDELEQQLQAMAGPGAGPNGGQIYIDGFTGGQMPPKNSIREVRINSNPFSPEYDKPGFGRIEIFTKPGTDNFHGQIFTQFNDQYLNSRSPLLDTSLPPYKQLFYGATLGGPIKKQKASFTLDAEHRDITENAFVLATTLDSSLNPQTLSQAISTPQLRTSLSPRIDYALNPKNTLTVRYQYTRIGLEDQGVGNFDLTSQAYNQTIGENTLQLTETAVLSATLLMETRFQFLRSSTVDSGAGSSPAIAVDGAFTSGGNTLGNSRNVTDNYELSHQWTMTRGTQSIKWGGRIRDALENDTSLMNFNGIFTFYGGNAPALDSNYQPIAGDTVYLSALQVYERTLLLENAGLSASQIRTLGGGASLFTMNAGTATTQVNQFDFGVYVNDDWRIHPNLTFSYGLRYEGQTNIHDWFNWAPRFGLAWGIDGGANKSAKTVLRAGFGTFYDRVSENTILSALRYNGKTQQSYLITDPDFFPNVPSATSLAVGLQRQQLQLLYSDMETPRTYQASLGVDRQISKYARVSANYITSRGVHLLLTRDINAPINGVYPYGVDQAMFLTEPTGLSRTNQLFISPNINYKKTFLFGFYALSYGYDNDDSQPANPYNLRAEWGPSTIGDVRHRAVLGASLPLPWKLSISPFIMASSGTPYDITTGLDTYDDGVTTARPALLSGASAASCAGTGLVYEPRFGCFDLDPGSGQATIERNSGRGPANVTVNLRLARTWSFGHTGESGINQSGPPPGMGGARGSGGPPPGGPGGGGPPSGLFGDSGGRKYNLTLGVFATNVLNHPNYGAPNGDLSSPFFGQYVTLASAFGPPGASTASPSYNRKISIQLRFTF
jgi:hypothetical protein